MGRSYDAFKRQTVPATGRSHGLRKWTVRHGDGGKFYSWFFRSPGGFLKRGDRASAYECRRTDGYAYVDAGGASDDVDDDDDTEDNADSLWDGFQFNASATAAVGDGIAPATLANGASAAAARVEERAGRGRPAGPQGAEVPGLPLDTPAKVRSRRQSAVSFKPVSARGADDDDGGGDGSARTRSRSKARRDSTASRAGGGSGGGGGGGDRGEGQYGWAVSGAAAAPAPAPGTQRGRNGNCVPSAAAAFPAPAPPAGAYIPQASDSSFPSSTGAEAVPSPDFGGAFGRQLPQQHYTRCGPSDRPYEPAGAEQQPPPSLFVSPMTADFSTPGAPHGTGVAVNSFPSPGASISRSSSAPGVAVYYAGDLQAPPAWPPGKVPTESSPYPSITGPEGFPAPKNSEPGGGWEGFHGAVNGVLLAAMQLGEPVFYVCEGNFGVNWEGPAAEKALKVAAKVAAAKASAAGPGDCSAVAATSSISSATAAAPPPRGGTVSLVCLDASIEPSLDATVRNASIEPSLDAIPRHAPPRGARQRWAPVDAFRLSRRSRVLQLLLAACEPPATRPLAPPATGVTEVRLHLRAGNSLRDVLTAALHQLGGPQIDARRRMVTHPGGALQHWPRVEGE